MNATVRTIVFIFLCLAQSACTHGFLDGSKAQVSAAYRLTIDKITPEAPVQEHSSLQVDYTLVVNPGVAGARPMEEIVICVTPGRLCSSLGAVTPPVTLKKTLYPQVPAAESQAIEILVCTKGADGACGKVRAQATKAVSVFARYEVFIRSIKVLHTRALQTDTIHVGMAGRVHGNDLVLADKCNPPNDRALCKSNGLMDVQDGTHDVTEVGIGPFDLVPEQEASLDFAYAVTNFGFQLVLFWPDVDEKMVKAAHEEFMELEPGRRADLIDVLNDYAWQGCDGPTAASAISIGNRRNTATNGVTLELLTRSTGMYVEESDVFEVKSPAGCGGDSRYTVTWGIRRASWRAPR